MLVPTDPSRAKFICGLIYTTEEIYQDARRRLQKRFGEIDYESKPLPFIYTDYYEDEMGKNLTRRFISFRRLYPPQVFVKVKHYCIHLERKCATHSKRTINIDPGYLTLAKLVLTSTKDFSHRIYLGKGIYAEVTLQYRDKKLVGYPWTFPDYRSNEYKDILLSIRTRYKQQLTKNIRS